MDLPPVDAAPLILSMQDGIDWRCGEVNWQSGGWLTVWVDGLSPEADPGNLHVIVSGIPHHPESVDSSTGQVNVRLRPLIDAGLHKVELVHRGARSSQVELRVIGSPPPIRGLEYLVAPPE